MTGKNINKRLPDWLKRPFPAGIGFDKTSLLLADLGLETICTNAACPNRGECWDKGTATILILGKVCTRGCKFCSVDRGIPFPPDKTEPQRVAELAERLKLKYLVITSVTRDDLPDGGAGHFAACINAVRKCLPDIGIELLVPDFKNCRSEALEKLAVALPFVFGHNVETVPRLYKTARSGGDYQTSLALLKSAKEKWPSVQTKSSIMLGLGESDDEVEQVLKDLRLVDCQRLAIGQYLKPSKTSLEVVEYITPEKFAYWADYAKNLGFTWVRSSPFTRSSYNAGD